MRDAASTRLEEKFYGARGDGMLTGENVESSQRLTPVRRPGSSVYNSRIWDSPDSFYEFRQFNANEEQILVMVDQANALYDGTGPDTQIAIWNKQTGSGQSFMQSVGNSLYWGDGASQKKWITTLQTRIPYVQSPFPLSQDPYNFIPFELDTFIVDSNGNAEQLIATVLQLNNFYILNDSIVFSLKTSVGGVQLPKVYEILEPGLQIWFDATSQVADVLGATQGITLTIQALVGILSTASIYKGGAGYTIGDVVNVNQTTPSGSMSGTVQITATGNAAGLGYVTQNNVSTSTSGNGSGAIIDIVATAGGLVSASVVTGGAGYAVNDYIYPSQGNAYGGVFKVTVVSTGSITTLALATGAATAVTVITTGEGYYAANNVPVTGGTGVGLTLNITDDESQFSCPVTYSGGSVTSTSIDDPGTGYLVGDVVVPQQPSQSAATGLELTVTEIEGPVSTLTFVSGGPTVIAYTTGVPTYTTSGAGTGAAFNITSVSGGAVTAVSVTTAGSGFSVGDLIYLTKGSATGAILSVLTLSGSGIATISIVQGNLTGYSTATGVATTTSGLGTGLTINITGVTSGSINSGGWAVNAAGTGYAVGDSVYPTQTGASGAVFTVASIVGTVITGFSVSLGGGGLPGYPLYVTMPTTGGTGTGATIQLQHKTILHVIRTVPVPIDGGTGYTIGDQIFPTWSGSPGTLYGTVTAVSPGPGPIGATSITEIGSGYVSGTGLPVTGGTGTGATFNIVVGNDQFYPITTATDTPNVFSGGNPISDSRSTSMVPWGAIGETTIDGSALWFNRGPVIDNGLVYNWGILGGTDAPTAVVNNATQGWVANTYYNRWQFIIVEVSSSFYLMQLITAGKSGSSAPTWNTTVGQNTVDGTAVWQTLKNDSDTTLVWAAETIYTPGHVVEATVSSVSCVFQLQPYTGIMTQGTNFPVYCWQCNNQSGSDVGAAGEIPSGFANAPMAQNGGQPVSTATYSGTMNSLFLSAAGGITAIKTSAIAGDGTVSGTSSQLFPGSQNLSVVMQPKLVIPAAGVYTFTIGHQVAMFWGIGNGSLELTVTEISQQGGILTVTSNKMVDSLLSAGVDLTFSGLLNASWLNGMTVTVTGTDGNTFTADVSHANYGPASDTGTASTGATLAPSVVSGPMTWNNSASPNTYNFSTGTPVSGYPIMSANYQSQGTSIVVDTVQISFPSAGVYPAEIYYGVWYHSIGSYSAPTTSPALPGTSFSFYMVYTPPGGTTNYNVMPQNLACSNGTAPTWPAYPTTLANQQAISPAYESVTEASGNFTWWNLGPTTTFNWNASVDMSLQTFIIDQNSNQEIPYEAGVSGTTTPVFSLTLYGLTADLANLVWMNNGPIGNTPQGTLTTTQGGWEYVVALVNTLDNTVSNASPPSVVTGNFFSASGVFISGGIPQAPDPQADYVAIFRTDDGGATFYLIPGPPSGNGNTEYTLPLAQYLAEGYTDTTPDSGLNTLLQAPIFFQNSVPTKGSINLAYAISRMFVSIGNVVRWSTGPDTPVGNGIDAFSPNNFAEFPSLVTRIVPLNAGIVIFTVSDIYISEGNGESGSPITFVPFLQRIGLLSYNALTVNGSIIYFMTTDQQVLELNVHSGISQIGSPIADQFTPVSKFGPNQVFTPASSYLTWHVNGNNDQCLFVADGTTGWFRLSPTAAPETGLTWSPKANIVGGVKVVQSIETTPGNIQLLLGPVESGPILYRDYNVSQDNGSSYPANFVLGALVLVQPGQLADVEFITVESEKQPQTLNGITQYSQPLKLAVLLGELSGNFEPLNTWTNDPPQLEPSQTVYSQRFYLNQTNDSTECRFVEIFVDMGTVNYPSEILSLAIFGGFQNEL